MNIENQHSTAPFPDTPHRQIIEYPTLVDTVQLSVARKLDIEGALRATSFEALLTHRSDEERERITNEVGVQFDDTLVQFVVGSLTGRRHHEAIILAEATEGINGHLPWEVKLLAHIAMLQSNGLLPEVSVQVERYSSNYTTIEPFADHTEAAQDSPFQQKHAA